MGDAEKLQRQFDALISGFVAPLLTGGQVQLGLPIAPGAIEYFKHASSGDAVADMEIFVVGHAAPEHGHDDLDPLVGERSHGC